MAQGYKITLSFPVVIQHMPANSVDKGYAEIRWHPIEMIHLRRFKEAMVSYRMYMPYWKHILNNWSTLNRVIPRDWKRLVTAVLEAGQQLQWLTWWTEGAINIEQQSIARGVDTVKDELLGKGGTLIYKNRSN